MPFNRQTILADSVICISQFYLLGSRPSILGGSRLESMLHRILLDQIVPTGFSLVIERIGVAGLNRACDIDKAARAIFLRRINCEFSTIQANGNVAVKIDCTAIRRNRTIASSTAIAKVCTNSSLRWIARTNKSIISVVVTSSTAAGRKITTICLDVGIDDDRTNCITICIRIQGDIQLSILGSDILVDRDVALCFKRKACFFRSSLFNSRINRNRGSLVDVSRFYTYICSFT